MDEVRARLILGSVVTAKNELKASLIDDGALDYIDWTPYGNLMGHSVALLPVVLDGVFTAEQLKAIAWWMENKNKS